MAPVKKNRVDLPEPETENYTSKPVQEPLQKSGQQVSGRWIEVWGLQVYYRTAGENGLPVLLIHGGGSDFSGFAWKHTMAALAEQYCVIAVDLPGYGQSQKPNPNFAYFDNLGIDLKKYTGMGWKKGRINPFWFHIHFIKAFLDALGLKKVNLVGISMGGGISTGVALEYPEYVEKLVLVSSYGLGDKMPHLFGMYLFSRIPFLYGLLRRLLFRSRKLVALGMGQLVYSPAALDDEMIDDAWQTFKKAGMHRTWQAFQKCEILPTRFRTDFTNLLPEISAPTLLIHGDHDKLIPLQWSKNAQKRIPNSELYIFKDCGHLPPREKAGEFVRVVRDYLK